MNNNQPDSEENADVALPSVPTLPPMEFTNMVAQIQPVVANPNSTTQRLTTRSRMKFKDGVRGNKLVFIQPEHVAKYPDELIDGSVILDGTVTTIPNAQKNIYQYNLIWMTNGLLPILFATEHLRCKFLKYNATELHQLQEA